MELVLQDGPRAIDLADDRPALSRRKAVQPYQSPDLWLVTVTLEIRAPVSWWKQARGYFTEVLWMRARPEDESSSERRLQPDDFEQPVPAAVLEHLNRLIETGARSSLHAQLPDSFVRRGVIHTNLSVLHDIIRERGHYNEGHWALFCRALRDEPRFEPAIDPHTDVSSGKAEEQNE